MGSKTRSGKLLRALMAVLLATVFMLPAGAFAATSQRVIYDAGDQGKFPSTGEQQLIEVMTDDTYTITEEVPLLRDAGTFIVPLMFDANGGVIDGEKTKEGANMHSVGRVFDEWQDADGTAYHAGDPLSPTPGGEDIEMTAVYVDDEDVACDTFPEAEREGYVLVGWAAVPEGSEILWQPGDEVPAGTTVTEGEDYAMFYAQWEQGFLVTFVNGVTGEIIGMDVVGKGEAATAPAAPEVPGYKFVKWDKDFTNVQEDLTVTAIYEAVAPAKYKALFDGNGASGTNSPAFIEFGEGEDVTLPNCTLTRDGYTFAGWSLSKDGKTDVWAAGTTLEGVQAGPDGTVTFYAQWKKADPSVPKTGDGIVIALGIAVGISAACCGIALLRRRNG